MTHELRNVPGLPVPESYSHVSIARGQRIVHLAGQVGRDGEGALGDGLAAQAEQAARNVAAALAAAEASPDDLVKLTIYLVDWDPSKFEALGAGLMAAQADGPWPAVPATAVGVESLFEPAMLVEIEAVAVAD
jgi:enamine deaminase RidA (YjgF/YER057c/UK114 family)